MTLRLFALSLAFAPLAAFAQQTPSCDPIPHLDHPHATIRNGDLSATLFLPDTHTGFYRSSRFDWSGVIACAEFHGHTLWGEWFRHYDPLLNDSITGPVEEFRSDEGALGYSAAAAPDGLFVKLGVGVLRRDIPGPYQFGHFYPIVDAGHWTTHVHRDSVTSRQQLNSPTGVRYTYTKTVSLEGSTVVLTHTLRNRGAAPITTDVYNHDFFMLDRKPTGPGMEIAFPFTPAASQPLEPNAGIEAQRIVYRKAIAPGETVASYLTGYTSQPADNHITVTDTTTGFGVEETGSLPLSKLYLWSIPTTICPEAYVHLEVAPAKTISWTTRFRLFTR